MKVIKREPIVTKSFAEHNFTEHISFISCPVGINIPITFFTPEVYNDLFVLVDEMDVEISMLGVVERIGKNFLVKEIFLTGQEVDYATCNLSAAGQDELFNDLLNNRDDGIEVCNSIRFWAHSHHCMGTSPSFRDEEQIKELALGTEEVPGCDDYFIRAIMSKHGIIEITIFLVEENLRFDDAPWSILGDPVPITKEKRKFWKEEIAKKVSLIPRKVYYPSSGFPVSYPALPGFDIIAGRWFDDFEDEDFEDFEDFEEIEEFEEFEIENK